MQELFERLEKGVITALALMMGLVIILATIELGWVIVLDIISPPIILLEIPEMLQIFGFFLLILIGVELLETIRAYLVSHVVHVEIVIEVALIAIARKVIILDIKEYSALTLLGIAALVIAVAGAYYLEHQTRPGGKRSRPARAIERDATEPS